MLKNRSRGATPATPALMAESGYSVTSPTDTHRKPTSFPRLFTGFTLKGFTENEAIMSPTSILDGKPFSVFKNPFWSESNPTTPKPTGEPETRHPNFGSMTKGVGLGIIDALIDEESDSSLSNPETRMVLFGSQLRIQIPHLFHSVISPVESPRSTGDHFDLKVRNSQLSPFSSGLSLPPVIKKGSGSSNSGRDVLNSGHGVLNSHGGFFTRCLSTKEMEESEDYTCVISHGPNPRTIHFFDDCIIESCCGVVGFPGLKKENETGHYSSDGFLKFCYTCKKDLEQGKDIFMYRGEKAFCSDECRFEEMSLEEEGI